MKKCMKKILCGVVVFSMCSAVFVGCKNEEKKEDSSKQESVEAEKAIEDKYASMTIKELYDTQVLDMEGLKNPRELGGYVGKDGKVVKSNCLYRTGKLSKCTEADLENLQGKYNLKTVIDLRGSAEVADAPDPEMEGVENIFLPFYEETGEGSKTDLVAQMTKDTSRLPEVCHEYIYTEDYTKMYIQMFESEYSQGVIKKFFEILSEKEDGAVLWHCSEGKDRTGVCAVCLLSVLGVDREVVLKDFEASNVYYAGTIDYLEQMAEENGFTEEEIYMIGSLGGVNRKLMEEALTYIDDKYGSMEEYLINEVGISKEDISTIQKKYLE